MTFKTSDLCDVYDERIGDGTLRVLAPVFQSYGRVARFMGEAVTVQVFEDSALVRTIMAEPGRRRVLMVGGGASMRCSLVGGQHVALAEDNGWAGIIVDGCVRDIEEIHAFEVGLRALGTHPRRSALVGGGRRDVPIMMAGTAVAPGNWVYADADGILVCDQRLA